ncbi:MAG: aminotransferase class I/II-fold pyridoxal phosphate-dependent enzyme [Saprospiraceae bacterium]|nr:aminotransferase class I/II-fold pyridoxal phosphate-dependent enzyme [Saprospiraceae bacterium]
MQPLKSKLPSGDTTIFTVMSAFAREHNAINLSQGFPDYDCPDDLKSLVHHYLDDEKNQYAPMPGLPALRQVIAQKVNQSYGCNMNEDNVVVTAGATQALFTMITAFVHEGDEVIVFEPAYDSYVPSILLAGGSPVIYEMIAPDFNIDWDHVSSLISDRTRMIIINSPHNPTGTILSHKDLLALQSIAIDHDLLVLSDEVYEHLVYDELQHESVLRYPDLIERSMSVFSFGKTFHSTGWKMGYIVGSEHLMQEFIKVHQWNVFCVNSFLQYALADYLKEEKNYNYLPQFYQHKRDQLREGLEGCNLEALPCRGTYFQLYNYSRINKMDDLAFAKWMTAEIGVASIPISVFYSSKRQDTLIRLCFAKQASTLAAAIQKLINI